MVNTRFWSDNFIRSLNPLDRYLFIYLLTNDKTNICGIYELPIGILCFETGIDKETIPVMLKNLEPKVVYVDGWVIIKNFIKHQATSSLAVQKGIKAEISKIPLQVLGKAVGIDTVYRPYIDPTIYLNLNINPNAAHDEGGK